MFTEFLSCLDKKPVKHIYTDGSKIDQYVGFAAVLQNSTYSGRLLGKASNLTVKMQAIKTALTKFLEANKEN